MNMKCQVTLKQMLVDIIEIHEPAKFDEPMPTSFHFVIIVNVCDRRNDWLTDRQVENNIHPISQSRGIESNTKVKIWYLKFMYKFSALDLPTMKYQGQITQNRIPRPPTQTLAGNVTVQSPYVLNIQRYKKWYERGFILPIMKSVWKNGN